MKICDSYLPCDNVLIIAVSFVIIDFSWKVNWSQMSDAFMTRSVYKGYYALLVYSYPLCVIQQQIRYMLQYKHGFQCINLFTK